jgi:hypothetical protein
MKLLLVTKFQTFVPDIDLILSDGKTVKNIDLPLSDRIECEVEYASKREVDEYYRPVRTVDKESQTVTTSTVCEYNKCVSSKCGKITGILAQSGITNGETLTEFAVQPVINELIESIYNAIMGFAPIKDVEDPKEPDSELSDSPSLEDSENGGALGDTVASE